MNKLLFLTIMAFLTGCHSGVSVYHADPEWEAGALLGEGAFWHPGENCLYWVDIERGEVHLYDPVAKSDNVISLGKKVGTVVPHYEGGMVVALVDGIYFASMTDTALFKLADPEPEMPSNRFNDGKADPAGRLWAGTMSVTGQRKAGALYCIDLDGTFRRMVDSVSTSNGIVWKDNRMYYIDTPRRTVREYEYDLHTGNIHYLRDAVVIPDSLGFPDGMAIDSKGNLWVAHWGGASVGCYEPSTGELLSLVWVPAKNVTSCAFGGTDLSTLYITTASVGMSEEDRERFPEAGDLFSVRPGVRGVPSGLCKVSVAEKQ